MVEGAGPGIKARAVKLVVPFSGPPAMVPVVQMPTGLGQPDPFANVDVMPVLIGSHSLACDPRIATPAAKRSSASREALINCNFRCEPIVLLLSLKTQSGGLSRCSCSATCARTVLRFISGCQSRVADLRRRGVRATFAQKPRSLSH